MLPEGTVVPICRPAAGPRGRARGCSSPLNRVRRNIAN